MGMQQMGANGQSSNVRICSEVDSCMKNDTGMQCQLLLLSQWLIQRAESLKSALSSKFRQPGSARGGPAGPASPAIQNSFSVSAP
jgi:hypothetical protein